MRAPALYWKPSPLHIAFMGLGLVWWVWAYVTLVMLISS